MPMISVTMLEGRSPEVKAALVRRLTETFLEVAGRPGQSPDTVQVVLTDVAKDHWAQGGVLHSEK